MVNNQYLVKSLLNDQMLKRTFDSTEVGMPQAIYDLAKTYIAMRNFNEAIAWSCTLAENPNFTEQAIDLLSEIINSCADAVIITKAYTAIVELCAQTTINQKKQKELSEKYSFLVQSIDDI